VAGRQVGVRAGVWSIPPVVLAGVAAATADLDSRIALLAGAQLVGIAVFALGFRLLGANLWLPATTVAVVAGVTTALVVDAAILSLPGESLSAMTSRVDLRGGRLTQEQVARIDLRTADISGASLDDLSLSYRRFDGVRAAGTSFRNADLFGASLMDADLSGADLRDAKLTGAFLTNACLQGADLRGAVLTGVRAAGADIRGALLPADAAQVAASRPTPGQKPSSC
jgi:uncharacterized protein YjbI with pentapeptide repeats